MKTINVYILQANEGEGIEWVNYKLTTSFQEAKEWFAKGNDYDFEFFKLSLPQEIQVQADY